MGRLRTKIDYENLRNARILENQARLASLGLEKTISDLRSITSSAKSVKTDIKRYCKVNNECTPLRRSNRLKGLSVDLMLSDRAFLRLLSYRSKIRSRDPISPQQGKVSVCEQNQESLFSTGEKKRPANAPLVRTKASEPRLSPDVLASPCESKAKGSVYDPDFGICCHFCREKKLCGEEDCKRCRNLDMKQPCIELEKVRENKEWMCPHCIEDKGINRYWICNSYENLRKARILENQARLASLGLQKTLSDLRSITSSAKSEKKKYCKVDYECMPMRRSDRLKGLSVDLMLSDRIFLRHSNRLKITSGDPISPQQGKVSVCEQNQESLFSIGEKRPANAPLVRVKASELRLSPDVLARRCESKGRGKVYDPVFGICCHFCRQKTLCSEEDCKRCGNLDMNQPCIGKTDCSVCHSSYGVLCRACLKVRYGEELEEVWENEEWMCPHCVEDKGINRYWICNSSLCLKKRKMAPTGLAIFRAREMGYKSVAHLLMDELQRAENADDEDDLRHKIKTYDLMSKLTGYNYNPT